MGGKKKVGGRVEFTVESWKVLRGYQDLLGFGTAAALVQAAVIEYLTKHQDLYSQLEKAREYETGGPGYRDDGT